MDSIIEHMKLLLGGSLSLLAISILWKLFMKKVPDAIVDGIMEKVTKALEGKSSNGEPIGDVDDMQLLSRITMAVVIWAEKKLPDSGMGEEKMRLVLDRIYKYAALLPICGSRLSEKLKDNESRLKEFISALVAKMNDRLKKAGGS